MNRKSKQVVRRSTRLMQREETPIEEKSVKEDIPLEISIEPQTILFKFICSCTNSESLRNELKKDFEDEKWVNLRRKFNSHTASRRGRIGEIEINLIKKYYALCSRMKPMKYPIPLETFKDTKSFEEDTIKTLEDNVDEVNLVNVKHFVATIIGRSYDVTDSQYKKEFIHQMASFNQDNFTNYLEHLRYHFETFNSSSSESDKHEGDLKQIYLRFLDLLKSYMYYQKVTENKTEKVTFQNYDDLIKELYILITKSDTLQKNFNESLHELLWRCSNRYFLTSDDSDSSDEE
ncbi:hypothetical protein ABK040_010805 [Willaertia magna]